MLIVDFMVDFKASQMWHRDFHFLTLSWNIYYIFLYILMNKKKMIFFLPKASFGLRVLSLPASVCLCVHPSVCMCGKQLLVRAITHHPFKVESPNLDYRYKRPLLRSLLFWGLIDLDLQGQIQLQSQNLPHFELVCAITHHPFKLGPPNLDQMCKILWLRSILFWGLIELDMSNLTYFQNTVYLHRFCVFEIFVRLAKTDENGVCSTSYMAAHIYVRPQGRVMDRGTVDLYL